MPESGKNPDIEPGWIMVVAGALQRADGRWLMHLRPEGKHHAGLWEFPGGKVEDSELPVKALIRELREELGVECFEEGCKPAAFAENRDDDGEYAIVILLYTVSAWLGEPASLEGGGIGWFTPEEVLALARPPLDVALAARLFENQ